MHAFSGKKGKSATAPYHESMNFRDNSSLRATCRINMNPLLPKKETVIHCYTSFSQLSSETHVYCKQTSAHVARLRYRELALQSVSILWATYTIHIPVMVKMGRLSGRTIHRDMATTWRPPLQTTTVHMWDLTDSVGTKSNQNQVVHFKLSSVRN